MSVAPSTINELTHEGRSALHFAVIDGHADAVSCLLAAGARHPVTVTVTQIHCPLGVAVAKGNVEVVRVLIADGLGAIGGAAAVLPLAVDTAVTSGSRKSSECCSAAQEKRADASGSMPAAGWRGLCSITPRAT